MPVSSETSAVNIVTPALGPVLGHGARGDVDVQVALLEEVLGDAELLGVGAHVGERRLRRLLHHVAELAGELQLARAVHARRLDEEDLAADAGPGEAGGDAGLLGALGDLAR